ncbi:redoxin domain-containing protein [Bacillus sp. 3255]|uniref:redoxin domain-containing protein n=1 Tax=Bacillus sp. 3255 TaxID=2817904 RepID=UPI002861CA2C|nr:redoxin domain-containing protein [Bacillus sp. 3255]MDR6881884.1 peroxiredoxin/nucleoside-diphosphate-sugar epimerase [Bacillus sp. 3255]
MKILVLGGTTFFGRRLVQLLLGDGHDVTIATRGRTPDDFGDAVTRIKVDRKNQEAMMEAFGNCNYDVVYDQICFNPQDAKIALEVFRDHVKRYVLTSSMAVYSSKDTEITEEDFMPEQYSYDLDAQKYEYAEGKRQAEAYFFRNAVFPVVAVRVAMVVSGTDDYTGRFDYYVRHVAEHKSIGVLEAEHPITYVTAWDAAEFLHFIGAKSDFAGPINAANSGYLSIQELCYEIGDCLNMPPMFHVGRHEEQTLSPYAMFPYTWKILNAKAASFGFEFPPIQQSISLMVQDSVSRWEKSLKDELDAFQAQHHMSPDAAATFARLIQDLRDQGAGKGLNIGDKAPDFTLEDATGKLVTLSEELAKGPVIIVFYRGEWCPYCNLQLKAYERIMNEIKAAGAQLIAISPQTPDHSLSMKQKHELSFFVLTDANNKTAENYNLKYKLPDFMQAVQKRSGIELHQYNGDHTFELPVTATYIIDKNGTVIAGASDLNHRMRMEPSEALKKVRSLQ